MTEPSRNGQLQLLLSFQRPFKSVSKDTISRWLRTILQDAGVDTNVFKSHSTRAASSSSAKTKGISTALIMNSVGWKSETTFAKYYNKYVTKENFGDQLLQQFTV